MEYENDQLVAEKRSHNGEGKTAILEEKKLWIPFGKISWPAIFAGVLVITVAQMLFGLLGIGIGIASIDPLREQNPTKGLGTATLVWWTGTMLVSLFLGGLTAGKMYQTRSKTYLTWHGLLTWATFTVFSFFMLTTTVGTLISGAGNIIGTVATAGASLSQGSSPDISRILSNAQGLMMNPTNNDGMTSQANGAEQELTNQNMSNQSRVQTNAQRSTITNNNSEASAPAGMAGVSNRNTSGQQTQGINSAVSNPYLINEVQYFFTGENSQNEESKEELVSALVNQTGMSRAEASKKIDEWKASFEELKAKAKVEADQAARVISTAAIIGFFTLILGALVSIWGARVAPMREYALAKKSAGEVVR